jgi:hypothetical protein
MSAPAVCEYMYRTERFILAKERFILAKERGSVEARRS